MNGVTYESRGNEVVSVYNGSARVVANCVSRDAAERIAAALNAVGHLNISGIKALGERLATEATAT